MGATFVSNKLKDFEDLDKKELARKSFELACDENYTWFITDQDALFKIGCGALLLVLSEEDKCLLKHEIESLNALSAAMSGVPVDMGAVLESTKPEDFIGVLGIFKEIYAASNRS